MTRVSPPLRGSDPGLRVIKVEPLSGDPYRAMLTNENMIRSFQGKDHIAHTREVLLELGYDDAAIARLKEAKAIGLADSAPSRRPSRGTQ
jgi:crotonobetainyl-CoA:carnitine CoA-transferase CaiB-like acyl-CoA transferase